MRLGTGRPGRETPPKPQFSPVITRLLQKEGKERSKAVMVAEASPGDHPARDAVGPQAHGRSGHDDPAARSGLVSRVLPDWQVPLKPHHSPPTPNRGPRKRPS